MRAIEVQRTVILNLTCVIAPSAIVHVEGGIVDTCNLTTGANDKASSATEVILGGIKDNLTTIGHHQRDVVQTVGAHQVHLALDIEHQAIIGVAIAVGAEGLLHLHVGRHTVVSQVTIFGSHASRIGRVLQTAALELCAYDIIINHGVVLHLLNGNLCHALPRLHTRGVQIVVQRLGIGRCIVIVLAAAGPRAALCCCFRHTDVHGEQAVFHIGTLHDATVFAVEHRSIEHAVGCGYVEIQGGGLTFLHRCLGIIVHIIVKQGVLVVDDNRIFLVKSQVDRDISLDGCCCIPSHAGVNLHTQFLGGVLKCFLGRRHREVRIVRTTHEKGHRQGSKNVFQIRFHSYNHK